MTLAIRYSSGKEDLILVKDAATIVGASPECDVVIADSSVAGRQLKLLSHDGLLEIENLATGTATWLNGQPLEGRAPFVAGDVIRVGGVTITACGSGDHTGDPTKSPDGVRTMWRSINRDVRIGWLGYRRVMEKLASFISPDEAKQASDCYEAGRRFFFRVLVVLFVCGLMTTLLKSAHGFMPSAILELCLEFFGNFSILLLVGRYRMSFAGRIIYPLMLISQAPLYAEESCDLYWSNVYWLLPSFLVLFFLIGWMVDYGAAFVHEKNRKRRCKRYLLLVATACLIVGLAFGCEQEGPTPLRWYWSFLGESPCLIWGLVYRWCCAAQVLPDSQFVAEIASRRVWKRLLYQVLSCVLLAFPVIGVLALLGDDERRQWPDDDLDVLWTDEGTKDEAWFWSDRGRYLRVSDLDANRFFQIPVSQLVTTATTNDFVQTLSAYVNGLGEETSLTNTLSDLMLRIFDQKKRAFQVMHPDVPAEGTPECLRFNDEYDATCRNFLLSDFATNICALVSSVSANVHDASAYAKLCEHLDAYRVTSTNHVQFAKTLGTTSVCVVCDSVKCHPEYGKEDAYVYSAGFQIGVSAFTRKTVDAEHAKRTKRMIGIWPLFVLAALAMMIFYRRGSDSPVGFWLGLGLFANVLVLTEFVSGFIDGIPDHVKYALWHGAFSNPLSALSSVWLSVVMSVKDVFLYFGLLSQSVLFVILCWPTIHPVSKRERRWIFIGKTFAALAGACSIGAIVGFFLSPAIMVTRVAVVISLGIWGWWLRRKLKSYTEIPQLGFGFVLGWLAAELAIAVFVMWIVVGAGDLADDPLGLMLHGWLSTPVALPVIGTDLELGAVLCVVTPVLVLASWIWLLLKQRFLNVLTFGSVSVILIVFALPLTSNLIGGFLSRSVQDNTLVSSSGMQLISAIFCVVLFPAVARMGRNMVRRVFMHDVCKMEQDVASAIEKVFDESTDTKDSIANILACMKISSFAFYERENRDNFVAILSRNWSDRLPGSLSVSGLLRGLLGNRKEVVDFAQLPYRPEYFFVSFELWRMHLKTTGTLMLPICLGTSVRGLLFIRTDEKADVPTAPSLVDCINSFGLSAVTPR